MKSGLPHASHVEQVRLLGLATRDMIWSWDAARDLFIESADFARVLGEIPKSFSRACAWRRERIHPSDRERVVDAFEGAIREGGTDFSAEYRFRKLDGSYLHVDERACFVRGVDGEIVR